MILLRILVLLVAILISSGIITYIFTGNRSHLAFAWRITRYALFFALAFMLLMFLERVLR